MELFKHNKEILKKYENMKDRHKNVVIVQGTGLGKTAIAIKIIEKYFKNKPILYVVPKELLKANVENNEYWNFPNAKFICYHSLKKYDPNEYSLCILDEVHRSGAPTWIKQAKRFIECEACNVLGLTATEIRTDGINVTKKVFSKDDTIHGLSIFDAIEQEILPKPDYVCAELEPEETIKSIEKSLDSYNKNKRNIISEKLKVIKNNNFNEYKLENIISKHSNGSKKFIIFTPTIEDCELWVQRFKHILHTDKVYPIHSKTPKGYNNRKMEYFNNYSEEDNIAIIGVDMLNEGLHIKDASQVIMLRDTNSYPVYMQMLGRALCCTDKNRTPVIYDLHKNFTVSECVEYDNDYDEFDNINIGESRGERIANYVNIIKDYAKDFNEISRYINTKSIIWTDEMIEELHDTSLTNKEIAKKYGICNNTVQTKRKSLDIKVNFKLINWTDEMIEDLYNTSLTNKEIAKKYGISGTSVLEKKKSLGIKVKSSVINWTDEMIEDLYNTSLSGNAIGKKYGISNTAIKAKRKSLGIKVNPIAINWTDEMIEDLYNTSLTAKAIGKKYGISDTSIRTKRKSLGIISDCCRNK